MTKRQTKNETPEELTEQELEAADGEPLPDRHALSLIRGHETLPMPVIPEPPLDTE